MSRSKRSSKNKPSKNLIFGALGGIAAGVVAGLLLAPKKGNETRKKIADEAGKIGTDVKNQASSGWKTVSESVSGVFKQKEEEEAAETKPKAKTNGTKA